MTRSILFYAATRMVTLLVVAASCGWMSETIGQPVDLSLSLRQWKVHWSQDRPLSGGVRVGLMEEDFSEEIDPAYFAARIPSDFEGIACVQISSRDKRYLADLEYEVPEGMAGRVRVDLPDTLRNELASFRASDVAILIRLAVSCEAETKAFAPASWSFETIPDSLIVLVNSSYPAWIIQVKSGVAAESWSCIPFSEASVTFNRRCRIPKPKSTDELYIRLQERNSIRDIPLPIHFSR